MGMASLPLRALDLLRTVSSLGLGAGGIPPLVSGAGQLLLWRRVCRMGSLGTLRGTRPQRDQCGDQSNDYQPMESAGSRQRPERAERERFWERLATRSPCHSHPSHRQRVSARTARRAPEPGPIGKVSRTATRRPKQSKSLFFVGSAELSDSFQSESVEATI